MEARATKVKSWYLDVSMLASYWGEDRVYHHTAPISMNYALREGLRLVAEEGLEARWARHSEIAEFFFGGLAALAVRLELFAPGEQFMTQDTYNQMFTVHGAIMVFLVIILGATDKRAPQGFAPIAIGLGLTLIHLISIPVTNTSVNPARSLATAVFQGDWALGQVWAFILFPAIGAVLAAAIWMVVGTQATSSDS